MAERSDYLYAQVRKKMLDAVRMDLIGPTAAEEALTELPTNSYITGMLYPADSDITEDENYNDVEFTEGRLDADGNGSDSVVLEDDEPDESTKGGFKKPSSIGVSFYLSEETNKINVDVYWGTYYSDKVDGGEVVDESLEEDYENKKKKKRQVYVREQMAETMELNLADLGRAKTIPLRSNAHIFVYVIQIELVITAPETFRIKTKKTRDVVENLIKNAEKSVVMTGYSISDYFTGMLDTIIAKSQQGVYVRFYVNDIEKSRASLVKMLEYRSKYLQFFEYEKNSDDKMAASHAKILTIDSDKSLVSSANLSYHGLSGNIEMGFLVRSADKAKQIEELLKELVRMHVYKKIS